jgi:hypothetical protein
MIVKNGTLLLMRKLRNGLCTLAAVLVPQKFFVFWEEALLCSSLDCFLHSVVDYVCLDKFLCNNIPN